MSRGGVGTSPSHLGHLGPFDAEPLRFLVCQACTDFEETVCAAQRTAGMVDQFLQI